MRLTKKFKKNESEEEVIEGLRSFYNRRVRNADHTGLNKTVQEKEYLDG
jgi:hypothetical protein